MTKVMGVYMVGIDPELKAHRDVTVSTHASCDKCKMLFELFNETPKTPRLYWVMTELFVMLHNGKDYCG